MSSRATPGPDRVVIGMDPHKGCAGIGKHIANRLLADGEQVVDVPPKLSTCARVFATGQGRKATPPTPTPLPRWAPG